MGRGTRDSKKKKKLFGKMKEGSGGRGGMFITDLCKMKEQQKLFRLL